MNQFSQFIREWAKLTGTALFVILIPVVTIGLGLGLFSGLFTLIGIWAIPAGCLILFILMTALVSYNNISDP